MAGGVQVGRGYATWSGVGEELLVPLDYENTWMGPLGVRSGFACFRMQEDLWVLCLERGTSSQSESGCFMPDPS